VVEALDAAERDPGHDGDTLEEVPPPRRARRAEEEDEDDRTEVVRRRRFHDDDDPDESGPRARRRKGMPLWPFAVVGGVVAVAVVAVVVWVILGSRTGTLVVDVDPPGAELFIDGKSRGVVADRQAQTFELSPGSYEVRVTKVGHVTFNRPVTIKAGASETLSVQLLSTNPPPNPNPKPPRPNPRDTGRKPPGGKPEPKPGDPLAAFHVEKVPNTISSWLAASPDGKHFVSCKDGDFNLKLWDWEKTEIVRELGAPGRSRPPLAFSPDGGQVAGYAEDAVRVWSVGTGRELASTKPDRGFRFCGINFDRQGRAVVAVTGSGPTEGLIQVYDVESKTEVSHARGPAVRVNTCLISPDGRRAVATFADNSVRVFDLPNRREMHQLATPSRLPKAMALSPDGTRLLTSHHEARIYLWDVETGRELKTLEDHKGEVDILNFSPDGLLGLSGGHDSVARVWDLDKGETVHRLKAEGIVTGIVLLPPDQNRAVVGNFGGRLYWYRLEK
jgi:DNA-binding beta-propeller fold protein YncE